MNGSVRFILKRYRQYTEKDIYVPKTVIVHTKFRRVNGGHFTYLEWVELVMVGLRGHPVNRSPPVTNAVRSFFRLVWYTLYFSSLTEVRVRRVRLIYVRCTSVKGERGYGWWQRSFRTTTPFKINPSLVLVWHPYWTHSESTFVISFGLVYSPDILLGSSRCIGLESSVLRDGVDTREDVTDELFEDE